jgi:hypothetical protein
MLNNQNLVRGVFLVAIALVFGLWSRHYPVGEFSRAGPGLFPMLVSALLGLIGVTTLVRAYFEERIPMHFNFKNIALVLGSLVGFALVSEYVNMIAGIVFMVFCSTVAGTSYSVVRNVKISVGLIAIAFALQKLLGVNLPLY